MMRILAFAFFTAVFVFVAQFARAECVTIQGSLKDLDGIAKKLSVPARAWVWKTPAFGEWRHCATNTTTIGSRSYQPFLNAWGLHDGVAD